MKYLRLHTGTVCHVARWAGFGRWHLSCGTLGWPPFVDADYVSDTYAIHGEALVVLDTPDLPVCSLCWNRLDREHAAVAAARKATA